MRIISIFLFLLSLITHSLAWHQVYSELVSSEDILHIDSNTNITLKPFLYSINYNQSLSITGRLCFNLTKRYVDAYALG